MSDIRLHTLRNSRTRNGYARHDSSRQQHQSTATSANLSSGSHPGGSPMPLRAPLNITTAAAAASSSSSSFTSAGRKKGRRRNEYGDGEPGEEATLLGEGERDPDLLHDDEEEERRRPTGVERVHEAASQVRVRATIPCPLLLTSRVCAFSDRRCGRD